MNFLFYKIKKEVYRFLKIGEIKKHILILYDTIIFLMRKNSSVRREKERVYDLLESIVSIKNPITKLLFINKIIEKTKINNIDILQKFINSFSIKEEFKGLIKNVDKNYLKTLFRDDKERLRFLDILVKQNKYFDIEKINNLKDKSLDVDIWLTQAIYEFLEGGELSYYKDFLGWDKNYMEEYLKREKKLKENYKKNYKEIEFKKQKCKILTFDSYEKIQKKLEIYEKRNRENDEQKNGCKYVLPQYIELSKKDFEKELNKYDIDDNTHIDVENYWNYIKDGDRKIYYTKEGYLLDINRKNQPKNIIRIMEQLSNAKDLSNIEFKVEYGKDKNGDLTAFAESLSEEDLKDIK